MDFKSDEFKAALFEYLSENLTIDVNTSSEYVGSLGDGQGIIYRDSHTLMVILENKVISTVYLS